MLVVIVSLLNFTLSSWNMYILYTLYIPKTNPESKVECIKRCRPTASMHCVLSAHLNTLPYRLNYNFSVLL